MPKLHRGVIMNFLEVLQSIEEIRQLLQDIPVKDKQKVSLVQQEKIKERMKNGQQKAMEKWANLCIQVRAENGLNYEKWLKNVGTHYVPGALLDGPILSNISIVSDTFSDKLYPLFELAHLYEQNGNPKEHASKVGAIFNDYKSVISWLVKYAKHNIDSPYPVHDACLFELPNPENCTVSIWKKLANQNNNMLDKSFIELLPHAEDIEKTVTSKATGLKFTIEEINRASDAVKKLNRQYREKLRGSKQDVSLEQKQARIDTLKELAIKKSTAYLDLAKVCSGVSIENMTVQMLQAYYELYKQSTHASNEILINHGISRKNIELFYSLKRCNDNEAIPDVFINGADIGYPSIYLKKLNSCNDDEAALAACLGTKKSINCCQYLGGAGTDCVKYGLVSPNSGFYVLFEGDPQAPNIQDNVLAQAWVWKSKSGALCFDSIEGGYTGINKSMIVDMYRYASHQICSNRIEKIRPITRVTLGAYSGIVRAALYPASPIESFIDYNGYSDALSQRILADSRMPYLYYGQGTNKQREMIKKECEALFRSFFESTISPLKNVPLMRAITFIFNTQKNSDLLNLLRKSAELADNSIDDLIYFYQNFSKSLDDNTVDLTNHTCFSYPFMMATLRNTRGETVLHKVANNSQSLAFFINLIPEEERLEGISVTDNHGETLLHKAANNPQSLAFLINLIPEEERLGEIRITDGYGRETVLHKAANNPQSLAFLINLIPEEERLGDISRTERDGETVLHKAANNPQSLAFLINVIPEGERLGAVRLTNKNKKTVLHKAANNPQSLAFLFTLIPEKKRLIDLRMKDRDGQTVFHGAANNLESLKLLVSVVPEKYALENIKMANNIGQTVLHAAVHNPESLNFLVSSIPEEKRFDAVKVKTKTADFGRTVLHEAANNPESLKVLITLIPEEKRLEALALADDLGKTVLQEAAHNSESLKLLIILIPEIENRIKATTQHRVNNSLTFFQDNSEVNLAGETEEKNTKGSIENVIQRSS